MNALELFLSTCHCFCKRAPSHPHIQFSKIIQDHLSSSLATMAIQQNAERTIYYVPTKKGYINIKKTWRDALFNISNKWFNKSWYVTARWLSTNLRHGSLIVLYVYINVQNQSIGHPPSIVQWHNGPISCNILVYIRTIRSQKKNDNKNSVCVRVGIEHTERGKEINHMTTI